LRIIVGSVEHDFDDAIDIPVGRGQQFIQCSVDLLW
jgi:hypothetical protein